MTLSVRLALFGPLLGLAAPTAHAVDYYWDTNGSAAGAGGATPGGTWSTTDSTLSLDAAGNLVVTPRTTTIADRVIFSAASDATGSYAVSLSGTQNIGRLTFQEGAVTLTGGTINFGTAAAIIDGDATPDTISTVLAGSNGVRFSGGTFTLNGSVANTYSGTTQVGGAGLAQATLILAASGGNAISGGHLQLGGNNGTSAGFVRLDAAEQINNTATVQLNAGHYSGSSIFSMNGFNETIGGLNLHKQGAGSSVTFRNGAATDATLTLVGSGTYTTGSGDRVSGRSIQNGGAGRLNVVVSLSGSGVQTFAGTDPTYTGTTTVNSGTLRLWNTSTWGSNATLNGGTLELLQTSTSTGYLSGAATRTHSHTVGGTGGTLRKTGNGTVILSGINTYQGATQIDDGVLQAGSTSAFGNNSAVSLANVAAASLALNGFNNSIGSLAGGGGAGGNVSLGAATLTTGGNNTSTSYAGSISGTGALTKVGSGTLTLTGSGAYTGATTVSAGTLRVNGSLAAASSVTVASGATLGGAGTVGGPVNVAAGAALDPGASAGTAGTLTTGALTLDASSQLNFDLGLANVVGGANNDLVQVNGDLTLGGSVNINPPGGAFANALLPGSYRLLNYTGALAGSTSIGIIPAGFATSEIQTLISGQVNLIAVQDGVPTQFWDGADTSGNGVLNGGTQNWNGAFSNWTNSLGSINQSWVPGVGIFGGTAGVATLAEPLTAMGLQFITDGYQVASSGGAPLTMVARPDGSMPFIRVDAGATVDIAAEIGGTAGLLKADAGTVILTGSNLYTGGTVISGGTLQLGDGGTSGSILGDVVNDGAFTFNRSDAVTFAGTISGSGTLNQIGTGTTTLTANNTGTGLTTIAAGTLQLGAGGTSGSILGNVVNDGALTFNRSDTVTFGGVISGGGALNHIGTGATVLTGTSSYTGTTAVAAGTLRINGALGASAVTVGSGATLGGGGTLGGPVSLGPGATLDPGSTVGAAGTLTMGALTMGAGSQINYDLGVANVVGGPSNDRLQVNGNLTLAGSINVNLPGSSFANTLLPGSYRLINYTGSLSGSTALGSTPAAFTSSQVQTVIAGQVNLIAIQDGVSTQFWDGADTSGDGVLNGGTQNWNNSSGNWTNSTGTINQSWVPGVGIFTGSAGVATIAESSSAMGLQFVTDGYQLASSGGALLTMVTRPDGSLPFIRVDPDATATISATITGTAGLSKVDTGTLVLSGTNTYTGGTVINGGTLQLGAGGTSGSVVGDVTNNGALVFNRSDAVTFDGVISGAGALRHVGAGTTILTADNVTTGGTTITAGTLQLGNGGTSGSMLGDVVNDGVLAFNRSNTLTFGGAISGTGAINQSGIGTTILDAASNSAGSTAVSAGTLQVNGTLVTPTIAMGDASSLVVNGTVQAAGAVAVTLGGSAGSNTIVVNSAATLGATGDLGDGDDVLDIAGTLDAGSGPFLLGDGDDTFVVRGSASVLGSIDAGSGNDLLNANIGGGGLARVNTATGFESLAKVGAGALEIGGSSDFLDVQLQGGRLQVASAVVLGAQTATVDSGATLDVAGSVLFTPGSDTFTVAGTVAGLGSVDMLDGDDDLTLLDGADLRGLAVLHGGAGVDTLTANIGTSASLGGVTGFETLIKAGAGSLTMAGPSPAIFNTVLVRGGVLDVAPGAVVDPETTVVDAGATLNVEGTYFGTTGADTFTLSGALTGNGTIDLLDGDDVLTLNTGATVTFSGLFDASTATGDLFLLAGAGTGILDATLLGTVFQNFDLFRKEGTGAWRLTGTGAQRWTVSEGTLIGDSASLSGDIANDATVVFEQVTDGTYSGVMSGSGTLIKQGRGTLVVAGTNTFAGNTHLASGVLQVDGVLLGTTRIESGATLSGVGTVGDVTALAGGIVQPGSQAMPFGTLTISGDYVGGGAVRIHSELGSDTSATSHLVIRGNASGGPSAVQVNRVGGDGVRTSGDGIRIIQIDGSGASDGFRLAQPVQAGAYEYLLYQGGAADANDWFLRSELLDISSPPDPLPPTEAVSPPSAYRPAVAGYVLGHQASLEYGFTALGTLRDRVGDRGLLADARSEDSAHAWMRAYASEIDVAGRRFGARDLQMYGLHFGTDLHVSETEAGTEHLGVMFSVGESRATFVDAARGAAGLASRTGSLSSDAKGLGLYWTRYGSAGSYFDMNAQVLRYQNDYRDAFGGKGDQAGWGTTLSLEAGSAFDLGASGWQLEPQIQAGYQRLELRQFSDEVSAVSATNDDALRARAAVLLLRAPTDWMGFTNASPYVAAGLQHDFRDAADIALGATRVHDQVPHTTGDVSVGFSGNLPRGLELHLDVRYQKSTAGEKDGVRANVGLRMSF